MTILVEWHPEIPDVAACRERVGQLTEGEFFVLDQMAAGYSPKEVARRRGVKYGTINNQLTNAFRKLGVSGHLQALAAIRRAEW